MAFIKVLLTLATLAAPAAAAANPGHLRASADVVSRERVAEQLRALLAHNHESARLAAVEARLRPSYLALPKDTRGSLEHRVARYALHRYFLVEHGWHVKGLTLDVEEQGSASPTELLKSKMPSFVMDLLEQQLGSDRLGLEELAVLAATIEDLVHGDAVDLVQLAYSTQGFSTDSLLDAEQADLVIQTFCLFFMLPSAQAHAGNATRVNDILAKDVQRLYPGWGDSMLWVQDIKRSLEYQDRVGARPFAAAPGHLMDFSSVAHLATTISAEFGHFSDLECKEMKNKMLDLEPVEREDGRVALSRFYAPYLSGGSFHFSESPAYLRHLGALDEVDQKKPSVIVPNVMYSKSNCMATSGFHAVCCIDHCEVLMSDLEQTVFKPAAAPEEIAAAVSKMASDTVAAPRNLSSVMQGRLGEIAARHGGQVPLHSRLFAQWMHYAFPNECPYPRTLLTSEAQLTAREWKARHGLSPTASRTEMQAAVELEVPEAGAEVAAAPVMLWSEDEELLSELAVTAPGRGLVARALRWAAGLAALLASVHALRDAVRSGRGGDLDKAGKAESLPWFSSSADRHTHYV